MRDLEDKLESRKYDYRSTAKHNNFLIFMQEAIDVQYKLSSW